MGGGHPDGRMLKQRVHQEFLVIGHIGHDDPQEIIPLARHGKAFDHFRAGAQKILEGLADILSVMAHANVAEDIDPAPDLFGIDQPDRRGKHARRFERLDPALA